jgi:D-beta-D-heptose 7-phosphate kinase/D-beta-D-heptose 1-phosphate adenosyltransferase
VTIPRFEGATVLVVGDVMLDRYWHGITSRISPEAPVPVVHVQDLEERPGGAGNVALNIAMLGAEAILLSITGHDDSAEALKAALTAKGVECVFQQHESSPTVTKLRVISHHQQLIRLDFERGFHELKSDYLLASMKMRLPDADVVILSDYGKGVLSPARPFIEAAREAGKPVLVDPKQRDFSHYYGASLITPNLAEFETAAGACRDEEELVQRGLRLIEQYALGGLLITRGEAGMTLLRPMHEPLHLPTQAREVYDVTGAGDTVISVLAAGLATGESLPVAMRLANLAAGVVVGKLGTAGVTPEELQGALNQHEDVGRRGVVDEKRLTSLLASVRQAGETIVMTNGCFDILHAGHVHYLEQAAQLGDRLIVAVNDDASVRRLKGDGRPINALAQRMAVLAGLSAVDWVISFTEDTPERLICKLQPDVLVKGGDYQPKEVAGNRCAGETRILPYVEGCSTTAMIDAIQRSGEL